VTGLWCSSSRTPPFGSGNSSGTRTTRRRGVRWEDLSLDDGSIGRLPEETAVGRRQSPRPGDLAAAELPPADGPADRTMAGVSDVRPTDARRAHQNELLIEGGTPGRNCRAPRVCPRPLAGARRGYSAAVDHNRRRTVDPPAALGNCRGRYRPSGNTTILLPTAADVEWERCLSARSGIQSLLVTWIT